MKSVGSFRWTAEASEIVACVKVREVSTDSSFTVGLDQAEREKELGARKHQDGLSVVLPGSVAGEPLLSKYPIPRSMQNIGTK